MAPQGTLGMRSLLFGIACLAIPIAQLVIAVQDRGTEGCLDLDTFMALSPYGWLIAAGSAGLVYAAYFIAWGILQLYVDVDEYANAYAIGFAALNGFRFAAIFVTGFLIWRDPDEECDETRMLAILLWDFIVSCAIVGGYLFMKFYGRGKIQPSFG
jgi:hypothetical protein